ncbi:hypothetical protein SCOCK_100023 [Actinacidiphila cocklensis]|uniref:Uncharacterized protein n=1 Tax=Actinacidiphila cocklensis TaxID=887465 RepID=A0A9W4GNV6_9ACTN|nr:hypothetical protein SCOCK_100023 [Actinacidiphila cocklensis]
MRRRMLGRTDVRGRPRTLPPRRPAARRAMTPPEADPAGALRVLRAHRCGQQRDRDGAAAQGRDLRARQGRVAAAAAEGPGQAAGLAAGHLRCGRRGALPGAGPGDGAAGAGAAGLHPGTALRPADRPARAAPHPAQDGLDRGRLHGRGPGAGAGRRGARRRPAAGVDGPLDSGGGAVRGGHRPHGRCRQAPAVRGGQGGAARLRRRRLQRADGRADEVGRQHLLRRRLRRLPGGVADVRVRAVRGDGGVPAGERPAGRVHRGLAAGADPRRRDGQPAAGSAGLRRAHPHRLVGPARTGRRRADHPRHAPAVPGTADRRAGQLSTHLPRAQAGGIARAQAEGIAGPLRPAMPPWPFLRRRAVSRAAPPAAG